MPATFLTPDQRAAYGRYREDLTAEQLGEHFLLLERELTLIAELRHDHTRLGFALQLCTLKFLNTFLDDPTDVPKVVLRTLAAQLRIKNAAQVLPRYLERRETRFAHQRKIVEVLEYKDFDGAQFFHVARLLISQYRTGRQRPIELFDLATQALVVRNVVLPGVTVLERFVGEVRQHCADRLYHDLTHRLDASQRSKLDWLLHGADGKKRLSNLEVLRTPPTSSKISGMNAALARVGTLRGLGVSGLDLANAPLTRLTSLTRDALTLYTG